jgi:hypothetical protein
MTHPQKSTQKKRNLFRRSGTVLCSCDVVVNTLALVMCSSVVHCVRVSWYDGRDAFLSCSLMIVSSWYMSTGLVSIISSIVWNVHICTGVHDIPRQTEREPGGHQTRWHKKTQCEVSSHHRPVQARRIYAVEYMYKEVECTARIYCKCMLKCGRMYM